MKIWQKSLIALGTIGTAAASIAVGLVYGYKDYDYNIHTSRGSFSTAIPSDLKHAKTYFAAPHDSYQKLVDIDTDTLNAGGKKAVDYAKSYLVKNGIQPMQVVEFAGTRFINDVPIYVQTETFLGFVNWFLENGEWGPEVSALDYIKISGETTNDGTLGAFASDNKTSNITYYIGQFLGHIKVSSNNSYDELDKVSLLMMMMPSPIQEMYKFGLMYKFNKSALTLDEVKEVTSKLHKANDEFKTSHGGKDSPLKVYSINFNRSINGQNYYDIYMDNSRGILDSVIKYEPALAQENFVMTSKVINGHKVEVPIRKATISPNTNISMLDILAANNKIPNGLSLDFLKYTILHEYGHHQMNTAGSRDSSEQPVMAKASSQAGLSLASNYINIDSLNEYFAARIPELKAVRMNSLMHVAPAHTDPANYPFVVLQYLDGNTHTWKTMSPQEVFDIQNDGSTLGLNSLTNLTHMDKIQQFAVDHKISLMAAVSLINMDVWNSTVTPKNYVGEKIPVFIKEDNGSIKVADRLTIDASGVYNMDSNNAGQWVYQFKDQYGTNIFDNKHYIDAKALITTQTSVPDGFGGQTITNVVPRIWPEDTVISAAKQTLTLSNGETIDVYDGDELNSDPTILIGPSPLHKFRSISDNVKIPSLSPESKDLDGTKYLDQAFIDKITKQIDPSDPSKGFTIEPRKGSNSTFIDKALDEYFIQLKFSKVTKRFNTKAELKTFYEAKISHIVFNYFIENGLFAGPSDDGTGQKNTVPISSPNPKTFNEANNEKVSSVPTTNENVFGYETSFSEILTRDYAQLLYDETYANPLSGADITSGALNSAIPGVQDINPLLQSTSLNPAAIVSSITEDWAKENGSIFADGLTIWQSMQNDFISEHKELLLEKTLLAKEGVGFLKTIAGFQVWSVMGWTKAISPSNYPPGVMSDLRMRMNLGCELYDKNGNPVQDSALRIKDLLGATATDRVKAMWMYVLHQKGVYGVWNGKDMDRTVSGIWHSLDKDAYTMWGYLKTNTKAKYITFEDKDGIKKSFKLNFGDHLYYHQKQFDHDSIRTLREDGYIGWSIDYKTMGTYASADLTSGEYKVYFSNDNKEEIRGLFSMGSGESHRNYVANNNFFHTIASVYFKNENENDETILVVKDYF